jgi:hypothetical protein
MSRHAALSRLCLRLVLPYFCLGVVLAGAPARAAETPVDLPVTEPDLMAHAWCNTTSNGDLVRFIYLPTGERRANAFKVGPDNRVEQQAFFVQVNWKLENSHLTLGVMTRVAATGGNHLQSLDVRFIDSSKTLMSYDIFGGNKGVVKACDDPNNLTPESFRATRG